MLCWLRYTSRYVPFCFRQAQDALHHGRMDQKDRTQRALVVGSGSGMCRAGFSWYFSPRAVFFSVFVRPKKLGIVAGRDVTWRENPLVSGC